MQKKTILLVDDSPMMTQFLSIFLSQKYEPIVYLNPEQALNDIQMGKCNPHLVVTDLDMPEMNGKTLLSKIKGLSPEMPVIVVSGQKESNQRISCLEMGAEDFMTKPFHPAELEVRISKHITPKEPTKAKISLVKELMKAAAMF
jgi:DNA-binding response OmpR family regulator